MLACVLLITGCASSPVNPRWAQRQSSALRDRLLQLDSSVDPEEAVRLADVAVAKSADLAWEYRAVRPAWLGNWMVNLGMRDSGLCYDWANDLYPRLAELRLKTLEIHLAVARMDTRREHNALVVNAPGHPFAEGLVLDAWRHSGRLWFGRVSADKPPWRPLPRDRVPSELQKFLEH